LSYQITETGQNGSIMTFFELTEGDLSQGTGEYVPFTLPFLHFSPSMKIEDRIFNPLYYI